MESVSKVLRQRVAEPGALCRDKLLNANFVKTNAGAGGATGYYTFRFSVK